MPTNLLFGTLLKELRISKNLKLTNISTQLAMDKGQLSKIENNERRATKEQLEKFIKILDGDEKMLSTSWLASKLIYELEDMEYGLEALKMAEQIIKNNSIKQESLENLTEEITALKNELAALSSTNANQLESIIKAAKIDFTFESNRIEGNSFSRQETALVLEKGLTITGKTMREHLEVINHAEAIDFITDAAKNKIPFTEKIVLQLSALVVRSIDKGNAGLYRNMQVLIGESKILATSHYLIPEQMEDYFLYYEANLKTMHPIILAADMHQKLITIYPFTHGNGLMARLVMNLIALQNGYPIINISGEKTNKMELDEAQNNNNTFRLLIANYAKTSLMNWIKICV